jgi:catechol 2,3-dioxygenase-like lactoylglutathione lyase family enzyme
MTTSKFLACCCACALVTLIPPSAQPQESHTLPAVIRTPLGSSSSQVLLSKFTVSNLAKSYEFYTTVIGLRWALSAGQQQPPAPQQPNASQPAFIEIPLNFSGTLADPFFVIVQQRGQKPTPETAHLGWVGFKVPDAPAAVRRAKEAGYEVVREAQAVGPGEMSIGIIRDPDGYSVELIQSANYPSAGH